jgi:flavin-dependent dehydrogenase
MAAAASDERREASAAGGGDSDRIDVAVLGGGLAGLSCAVELAGARPGLRIVVLEKRAHPAPEAAFKVGESTVQAGARYLERLGLHDHLRDAQLPKLGIRFFASNGTNRDITQRLEIGQSKFAPLPTYQIDRGRLENALAEKAQELGVTFRDGARVSRVDLDAERGHSVTYQVNGSGEATLHARWIVDASGRAGLIRRKLNLGREVDHDVNAVWFRVADKVDVDDWSPDEEWQARVPGRNRWLSTNHLHGPGYWVWIIPLASGSTSIGIVADPAYVPFERIRRFDSAMEWLAEHEPQVAAQLEPRRHLIQDFLKLKHYAYACTQVFSTDRWALTGEAGLFVDPLYSPGTDFIGAANNMIKSMVLADLDSDPELESIVEAHNNLYIAGFWIAMETYTGQYGTLGSSEITAAKTLWDTMGYFAVVVPLHYAEKFGDAPFMARALGDFARYGALNSTMQRLFRDWLGREDPHTPVGWAGIEEEVFFGLQRRLAETHGDDGVRAVVGENIEWMEGIAREVIARVASAFGDACDAASVDPISFSLGDHVEQSRGEPDGRLPSGSEVGLLWATASDRTAASTGGWSVWA